MQVNFIVITLNIDIFNTVFVVNKKINLVIKKLVMSVLKVNTQSVFKNNLLIILCLYLLSIILSLIISNYFIIWGESNSIKYPLYNLITLKNYLNFETSIFTNITDLPKGYHGGIVSSLITSSLLSLGKLLLIDPFIFSFFISSTFIFLGVSNFYFFFNKKINFKFTILLSIAVIFSSQHFLYLFSGSMPNVYNSIFIYVCSLVLLRINNHSNEGLLRRILFIFLFVFTFYAGAASYLIFFFLILFIHLCSYINSKKFIKIDLLIDYVIIFLLCLPFFFDVILHPYPPLGFNKVNAFNYLSAGFIFPSIFSKYFFLLYLVVIWIIWIPLLKFISDKKLKLLFYCFFLFGFIISSTKLMYYLNDIFPTLNTLTVRSGWRWTLLPLLLFIVYYCYTIEKKKNLIKVLFFLIVFNFISFIIVVDQRIAFNKIPNNYYEIVERGFFSNLSNTISLPISKKNETIFDNYTFFRSPKKNHVYPSSLFGYILPLKNYVDLDLSDHLSKKKYEIINSLYFQKDIGKSLINQCVQEIIIEKKKKGIEFNIEDIIDHYLIVFENSYFKILNAKNISFNKNCKKTNQELKKSYTDYLKKLTLDGQFLRANRKNSAFRYIYDEKDIFLVAKEKIYNYEFYAGTNYKQKWCINVPYPAKLTFYFKKNYYKNLVNLQKVEFLDLLDQEKTKVVYYKKDFEIIKKMKYCLNFKPNEDFIFYINKIEKNN